MASEVAVLMSLPAVGASGAVGLLACWLVGLLGLYVVTVDERDTGTHGDWHPPGPQAPSRAHSSPGEPLCLHKPGLACIIIPTRANQNRP